VRQALVLSRRAGDPSGEAEALTRLGVIEQHLGRNQQAVEHHQQAVAIFRHSHDPRGEAEALNSVGEALLALGRPQDTLRQHAAPREQAPCHFGAAMNLYAQLGAPEADQIRDQLSEIDEVPVPAAG
jgi:tetratricopeptide (TPR) repeat protein